MARTGHIKPRVGCVHLAKDFFWYNFILCEFLHIQYQGRSRLVCPTTVCVWFQSPALCRSWIVIECNTTAGSRACGRERELWSSGPSYRFRPVSTFIRKLRTFFIQVAQGSGCRVLRDPARKVLGIEAVTINQSSSILDTSLKNPIFIQEDIASAFLQERHTASRKPGLLEVMPCSFFG